MPFAQKEDFATRVGEAFGDYRSTFTSTTGQVRAQLFDVGGDLIAHVSFAPGYDGGTVTDRYVTDLRRFADEHGYAGRLRLVFSE